jgi:hypothetical protein
MEKLPIRSWKNGSERIPSTHRFAKSVFKTEARRDSNPAATTGVIRHWAGGLT